MKNEVDLVTKIFLDLSTWGTPPDESFEAFTLNKHAEHPAPIVKEAISTARRLQALVLKSSDLYYEPYPTIHEKVRKYVREGMPGLSEQAYAAAERRIMFMYIK
jgi:hypothetical protein